MYYLIVGIALLLAIMGILMIVSPGTVKVLNRSGNRVILSENSLLRHRFVVAAISLVLGGFLLYSLLGIGTEAGGIWVWPFIALGGLLVLFGLTFLFSAEAFEKITVYRGAEIDSEKALFSKPVGTGVFFLCASLIVFYVAGFLQ